VAGLEGAWKAISTVALVLSFFLAGEDRYPGTFYVGLQGLWMDGTYYVKLSYLLTLLTLLDVVLTPLIVVRGLAGIGGAFLSPARPAGWDDQTWGRRLGFGAAWAVLSVVWLLFTAICVVAPDLLSPVGFLAVFLLLLIPIGPITGPVLFFEMLLPPRYCEGTVRSIVRVENRGVVTTTLDVDGASYTLEPAQAATLAEGMRVAILASGFVGAVLRLERRS